MVLPGRVPEPEVEAVLEITNLESMSVKLAIWFCKVWPWFCMFLRTASLALVEIVPSVLIVIVSPIEIVLIISLMALNGRKIGRSNLIYNHLRSVTSISLVEICHDKCFHRWVDNFGKNDLPHKLHNFAQPLFTRAGVWFFLSRINALTISLSSATSGETDGVKELVLTLATTALLRD
ncbi:hypothetical protein Tco_0129921 [Tanacetum coccineum]